MPVRERQLPSDSANPLGSRRHIIDNDAFWHIEVFNCGYLTTPRERTLCDTKWQEILRHLHKALQEIQHLMRTKVPGRIAHATRRCKEIHTRSLKLSAYGRLLIWPSPMKSSGSITSSSSSHTTVASNCLASPGKPFRLRKTERAGRESNGVQVGMKGTTQYMSDCDTLGPLQCCFGECRQLALEPQKDSMSANNAARDDLFIHMLVHWDPQTSECDQDPRQVQVFAMWHRCPLVAYSRISTVSPRC